MIDAFPEPLNLQIAKHIIITGNKQTWDKIMTTVIKDYNNTPNTALIGINTNEAQQKAFNKIILKNQSTKTKRKTRGKI